MERLESGKRIESGRDRWVTRAILLSWFTIGYNLLEGFVSIGFGFSEESIALAGFGVDSLIEVVSAFLVLWRFRGESGLSEAVTLQRERNATTGIGILFLFLAAVTTSGSLFQLVNKSHPRTTIPGLLVSSLSLSFMFYLWSSKKKAGMALSSRTVLQDAACSLACIKLSFVLFCGSILFLVAPGLWWSDSIAALVISCFIFQEGWVAIQAARKEDFEGGCCGHD